MSAELNVKLVLDTSDIQKQLGDLRSKFGGTLGARPSQQQSQAGQSPSKSGGISVSEAFSGMLRSLVMYRAIAEAMKLLRDAVMAVVNAFQQAKKIYVQGAMSGYGTRLQTQRSMASRVLGVGEDDLLRVSAAYKHINKELKDSVDVISANARPLAETNMQWQIMKIKFEAAASSIAISLKPEIESFIDYLKSLADVLKEVAPLVGKYITALKMSSPLYWFAKASQVGGSIAGGGGLTGGLTGSESGKSSMPELKPQLKQLPSSTWEKMGLVIGAGGGTNYAKDTARNTSKMSGFLEKIANRLAQNEKSRNVFQSAPSIP